MTKKKIILGILLLCLGITLFLLRGKVEEKDTFSRTKMENEVIKKNKSYRRELIPNNPEDYGIIVFEQGEEPVTQGEWDDLLEEKIASLRSEVSFDTWAKLEKEIKEEPQKAEEKIKNLNERFKKAEAILRKDPDNQGMQKRIKRLKMLRAIYRSLAP